MIVSNIFFTLFSGLVAVFRGFKIIFGRISPRNRWMISSGTGELLCLLLVRKLNPPIRTYLVAVAVIALMFRFIGMVSTLA